MSWGISRFWVVWGSLVMSFVGGLISVAIAAFMAWHNLDVRVELLQQSVSRIELRLGAAPRQADPDDNTFARTNGGDR